MMKLTTILLAAALALSAGPALAQRAPDPVKWRQLDPENTLYINSSQGPIVIEMFPEVAPQHVQRIKELTREHFYDGLIFHRVLDKRLSAAAYLGGEHYSIADIATFPWVRNPQRRNVDIALYPHVARWLDAIAARPAVQRGVEVLAENQRRGTMTDAEREIMFGKTQFAVR